MIELFFKIPKYLLFRKIGIPRTLPLALTVNVTNRCNSRCMTCKIYNKNTDELNLENFKKTFSNLKNNFLWLNITGGEPFLRKDLVEICQSAYNNFHPKMINIHTNGILYEIIPQSIDRILNECPKAHITLNLSLDEFGENHDRIRGVKDNFKMVMETFKRLRTFKLPNFTLGLHSVISKYNIKNFFTFYRKIAELKPDSYTIEIAQERVELDNIGLNIQPDLEDCLRITNYFRRNLREQKRKGLLRIIKSFCLRYYELAARILKEQRQVIPCYAGFNSAYISSGGEIWACCVKGKSMGNLKDNNYDFQKIWFSNRANKIREEIKNERCFCATAGISYVNMLCHMNSLLNSGLNFLRFCLR